MAARAVATDRENYLQLSGAIVGLLTFFLDRDSLLRRAFLDLNMEEANFRIHIP